MCIKLALATAIVFAANAAAQPPSVARGRAAAAFEAAARSAGRSEPETSPRLEAIEAAVNRLADRVAAVEAKNDRSWTAPAPVEVQAVTPTYSASSCPGGVCRPSRRGR